MVSAYQTGDAFEIDMILLGGHVEVKESRTGSYDAWVIRAPSGGIYPIENEKFRRTYEEILERTDGYRIKTCDQHREADSMLNR